MTSHEEQGQQVYITYPVTLQLVQQAETLTQQIRDGNIALRLHF